VSSVVHLSSPAGNITLTPPSFLPSIQSLIPRGVAATPEALQEAASKRLSMLSEGSAVFTSGGMKGQRVSQTYLDQVLGQNVSDFIAQLGSGSRSAASQSAIGGASAVGVAFGGGYHPSGSGGQPLHYSPTRTSNPTSGDTIAPVDLGNPAYQAPYGLYDQVFVAAYPAMAFSTDLPGTVIGDPTFGNPYFGGGGPLPFSPSFAAAEGGFSTNPFDGGG
jgi:hypothetical protein